MHNEGERKEQECLRLREAVRQAESNFSTRSEDASARACARLRPRFQRLDVPRSVVSSSMQADGWVLVMF